MYTIIVNPASKSGQGLKIWHTLEPILKEKAVPYHVMLSQKTGHVVSYVKELTAPLTADTSSLPLNLIILGGDGTLNEVLQGISCFEKVRLGYIPTGSGNDMARDLELPKEPAVILERILSGTMERTVDIGLLTFRNTSGHLSQLHPEDILTKRYFAVSSGIGFDAAVCVEVLSSHFKNVLNKLGLGKLTYLIIALKQIITAKKISCNIYLDNGEPIHYKKFLFTCCMVHRYEGGGFKFCPAADDTDGLFDICIVGGLAKPLLLLALPTAFFGKHYAFPGVDGYRCSSLRIETSIPLWVHTDGEVQLKSNDISMSCIQEKLHLLV